MPVTVLHVRDVQRATPRTRFLRLELGASGFTFAAGQAVMAGLHGSPLRKPYSIASAPSEADWFHLGCQARGLSAELLLQPTPLNPHSDPHLGCGFCGWLRDVLGRMLSCKARIC